MCDVTNAKLGLPNGAPQCATCGSRSIRDCDGKVIIISSITYCGLFSPLNAEETNW